MKRQFKKLLLILPVLFLCFQASLLYSCNSWSEGSPAESNALYLPLNDSDYPYAGLPRLVIETEDFRQVRNKETKVPAYLQIYNEKEPASQIYDLTIKGRGNSSFVMTKYGYKIKFAEKNPLLGMSKDKEWDLVSNFRDKSMLRNYVTYQLAGILGDDYYPKCKFVELYLNREYLGIFLLVEHVKVSKKRVNISKSDSSFLFEKTSATSTDGTMFTSSLGYIFKFCQPKEPDAYSQELLKNHVNDFENFLRSKDIYNLDLIGDWIDIEDFIRYYWIQEFTKNVDGHRRSIFITWEKNGDVNSPLEMGPVWDFDLGYGNSRDEKSIPEGWLIRKYGWDRFLFKNKDYEALVKDFWKKNRPSFVATLDSIEAMSKKLEKASENEFKRWPVLGNDTDWPFMEKFDSYKESVDALKYWIEQRIQWIDESL
ncbi:MAG: CotH kinase family protein [Fibrobacter sp.]|uniref:CotH kinase family protein n=1 Tax=Fibrobacter sp. TaxID=35828 RepID=UPI00388DA71B|nr:CotH kinase family protein [Fibrobacter sp.]